MDSFLFDCNEDYFVSVIYVLSIALIRKKWKEECNYDCSKCRVWDCEAHDCIRQKEKEKKK